MGSSRDLSKEGSQDGSAQREPPCWPLLTTSAAAKGQEALPVDKHRRHPCFPPQVSAGRPIVEAPSRSIRRRLEKLEALQPGLFTTRSADHRLNPLPPRVGVPGVRLGGGDYEGSVETLHVYTARRVRGQMGTRWIRGRFGVDPMLVRSRRGVDAASSWSRYEVDPGVASRADLGSMRGRVGPLWGRRGVDVASIWVEVGSSCGRLKVDLGPSWSVLERSGADSGRSRARRRG